jgi:hypothetical protein
MKMTVQLKTPKYGTKTIPPRVASAEILKHPIPFSLPPFIVKHHGATKGAQTRLIWLPPAPTSFPPGLISRFPGLLTPVTFPGLITSLFFLLRAISSS